MSHIENRLFGIIVASRKSPKAVEIKHMTLLIMYDSKRSNCNEGPAGKEKG